MRLKFHSEPSLLSRFDFIASLGSETTVPFALFCDDQQLSQVYETEAEVWAHAVKAGLVVDVVSDEEANSPPDRVRERSEA